MSELIKNSGVYQRLTSSTQELERLFKEVDEKKSPPDFKKVLLLMGLGTLSWISTYSGLLELIQANSGDIAFTYKLAIGFAVAMLMLMIVYILDQLFAPLNWLLRTIYIFGYIFLTIISVGFGFGFYWKFLESRSEATRSAESAVTQVQSALQGGQTRLEQLEQTFTSLTALSLVKAKEEREKGNSCPNSRPGDGPRRRLRQQDAKNFSFAGDFVTKRAQSVASDIKRLNGDLAKISSRHPSTIDPTTGNRNAFMKSLNQRLGLTITRFNAFKTDPQLSNIRNNLAERANTTIFPKEGGGTFKCPDNQLQAALRGAVQAIDQLPLIQKPKINAVEGSEATIEAFRRLGATLNGLLTLKMPPSEDQLRELRKKAVRSLDNKKASPVLNQTQPGLNERDYIPLAIAIFVDFCLLLVSINRPMDRLKSLVPVMKDARDGPISGILSSFHATHFAGMREEFSLFQHVVFDWGGHYYVAVPLASNDIQAQYLANLFVSLEGRGIVDRAMIPPAFIIRNKLKKMGSSFADHRAFRLYKFRNGAWSNIVMDAVMGAAKDVSIAMSDKMAQQQAGIPFTTDEQQQLAQTRKPNFASLFNKQSETGNEHQDDSNQNHVLNGEAAINHNSEHDDQPFIELPRLLRKASSEQPNKQNNIIAPAHFNRSNTDPDQQNGAPAHNNGAVFNGKLHAQNLKQNELRPTNNAPQNPAALNSTPLNGGLKNQTPWQTPHFANLQPAIPKPGAEILTWPQPETKIEETKATKETTTDPSEQTEAHHKETSVEKTEHPEVTTNSQPEENPLNRAVEQTQFSTEKLETQMQQETQTVKENEEPTLKNTPHLANEPQTTEVAHQQHQEKTQKTTTETLIEKETAINDEMQQPLEYDQAEPSFALKKQTVEKNDKPQSERSIVNNPQADAPPPLTLQQFATKEQQPINSWPTAASDIAVGKITEWFASENATPHPNDQNTEDDKA